MYRRRFSRFPRRKIIRRRRGLGKKRVSKSIKRYVKKAIHSNIENKEHTDYAANQTIATSKTTSYYSFALLPSLNRGATNNSMVGNQIKVVGGKINFAINLLKWNVALNPNLGPFWVKIWIVRTLFKAEQEATLPDSDQFFKVNDADVGFQGNVLDTLLRVNDDRFKVMTSRMFKIGSANQNQPSNPGTTQLTYVINADNSPFCKHLQINWGRYCRKQLKYTNALSSCMNDNLYFVAQVVPCDGTSNDGLQSAEIHYTNTIKFEDA